MRKLAKVSTSGKEMNQCPICGDACTRYAWETYGHCKDCHVLADQGVAYGEIRAIRLNEMGINLDERDLPQLESISFKQRLKQYDFEKKFPPGIHIVVNNKREARVLRDMYSSFASNAEHLDEFNTLMTSILSLGLEHYRTSARLAVITDDRDRKIVQEIQLKLAEQLNKSTKTLEDFKRTRMAMSTSVLSTEFDRMLKYHHDNQQEYHGVGICDECNKRIMFVTNFPTFKSWYLKSLEEIVEDMRDLEAYDKSTISELSRRIKKDLDEDSISETYRIKFKRQLEAALL